MASRASDHTYLNDVCGACAVIKFTTYFMLPFIVIGQPLCPQAPAKIITRDIKFAA